MAGGGAEEAWGRVTARDVEVLEFVARYGVVPRDAVAYWAGTGRSMTARREKRLREAGLLVVARPHPGEPPFLLATRPGLQLCTRDDLPVAKLSLASVGHFAATARLAARLERSGETLLSERELLAHERALGKRTFSVRLANGDLHRPDLISVPAGSLPGDWGRAVKTTAIEVELVQKGARRLDRIVAAWRTAAKAGRFAGVRYHCSPKVLPYVERAVDRTHGKDQVKVALLPAAYLSAPPSRHEPNAKGEEVG